MRINRTYYFILMMTFLISCAGNREKEKIRGMEEEFLSSNDPVEKSEIANDLHREYSVYHLNNMGDTSFLKNWALMAERGREYGQARWIYSELIKINPMAEYFKNRGRMNVILGFFDEAADDFARTAEKTSIDQERREMESLYTFYHSADSIILLAEEMMDKGRDININRLKRAEQLIRTGHLAAAESDLEQVKRIDSSDAYLNYVYARYYVKKEEFPLADSAINIYLTRSSENDEFFRDAMELRKFILHKERLEVLNRSLEKNPGSYFDLTEAGAICFEINDYNAAFQYFNRIITVFPDSLLGYLYRGQAFIQTGNLDNALKDLERAVSVKPGNISAHNLKAYVHLLRNEQAKLKEEVDFIISEDGDPLPVLLENLK